MNIAQSGNIYIEAEKKLAELLGWNNLEYREWEHVTRNGRNKCEGWVGKHTLTAVSTFSTPQWTRDNADAFKIMCEYGCYPVEHETGIEVIYSEELEYGEWYTKHVDSMFAEHIDKETCIRYAIVLAVIAKLENK